MRDNSINIVNVPIGPGSQSEGDMVLDYMKMPSEMNTYDMPSFPEESELEQCPQAMAILAEIQEMLAQINQNGQGSILTLTELPQADLSLLNQILGEGEVSVLIDGEHPTRIQETVMAGIWRLRTFDKQGNVISEAIEVAEIPECVRDNAFATKVNLAERIEQLPEGLLNAPSVLVEIADTSAEYQQDTAMASHVINLSLLPFSPEDHYALSETTGTGSVTILSRGYGNCRITSTQVDGLWRVQYYNSTDQLILDTLEIVAIPAVACAAPEDLADSAVRLEEIRDALM
ncbi:hydrogenase expression/formation protein [Alteromonas lipolytica]|uniref:Hydrogenase n=1 Tax=Alteromonas lipolytica TaxID=1856405 RepID=A0A1E8FDX5_9ALTE|nr:hydrogenase expression/formation protein [Alteromonas lipolytica]OFI34134.1 hydrogenase [Alteromonas lipolytica]GGF65126.1 hydrogenase expression/formation protein [Alteromonas lipolytica]